MEEIYKETACFTVDKYHLSKLKDDEAFKEFIIKDLSDRLADHLVDILSNEGEVIVKMSDVYCNDNDDFATVDYRRYLKWSHLVRCKDCKYWNRKVQFMGDNGVEYINFSGCLLGRPGSGETWFCADGEREETEDAVH